MDFFGSLNFSEANIPASSMYLRVANLICVGGMLLAVWAAFTNRKLAVAGNSPSTGASPAQKEGGWITASNSWVGKSLVALLAASAVVTFISIWNRYLEVNHFPSQTMSEVLVMFGFALLVSMFVLHYALRWRDHGPGWAIVGDSLIFLVLLGVVLTNYYSSTLTTAQRDLPPALQSYWFAPHLSALIFSYATLGIAGLLCAVYFCIRFWSVVRHGGRSKRSQFALLALLVLLPFAQLVTIPLLIIVGLVMFIAVPKSSMASGERLASMETKLDNISFRAFSVGIPFLTAGLFMGAFWAQEAWANYWGWDSKENSALITWLIYVVYMHLRLLGGYRGEKAMAVLMGGALSVFLTFQMFGYLPDSQKSLHRYTDDEVVPVEGQQSGGSMEGASARVERTEEETGER